MSDECAICLEVVKNRATIKCAHSFCFECIQSWSRTTNKCPLCKVEFSSIVTADKKLRVKRMRQQAEYSAEELARLADSSTEEVTDSPDEYEFDGFVVADEEEIEYKIEDSLPPSPRPSRTRRERPPVVARRLAMWTRTAAEEEAFQRAIRRSIAAETSDNSEY